MSVNSRVEHSGKNQQESVERRMTLYAIAAVAAGVSVLALASPASGEVVITKTNLIVGFGGNTPVSIDFNHNPASATFDLTQTKVIGGTFVRVLAWYDNEWGFSNRMSDVALAIGRFA